LVSFEIDVISANLRSDGQSLRNLPGKPGFPHRRQVLRRDLAAHPRDDFWNRECSGTWEALLEHAQTEEMIAMGMREINGGQVLTACRYPVGELLCVLSGQERINQNGISAAIDQRDRIGNPVQ